MSKYTDELEREFKTIGDILKVTDVKEAKKRGKYLVKKSKCEKLNKMTNKKKKKKKKIYMVWSYIGFSWEEVLKSDYDEAEPRHRKIVYK